MGNNMKVAFFSDFMRILMTAAIGLTSTSAFAVDGVFLGQPGYGGNGCPAGTVSAVLSPDAKSLSVVFDAYQVEVAGRTRIARKNCDLQIPVHVPSGWSFSVIQLDYRGFNSLPAGARSELVADYFFAGNGANSVRYAKTFTGPSDKDYLFTNKLGVEATVWSPCDGADAILRAKTDLRLYGNTRGDQALSTVDSVDIKSGLLYQFQWRRCR